MAGRAAGLGDWGHLGTAHGRVSAKRPPRRAKRFEFATRLRRQARLFSASPALGTEGLLARSGACFQNDIERRFGSPPHAAEAGRAKNCG
jgi:hypothetical protein